MADDPSKFSYYIAFSFVLPNGKMLINGKDYDSEGPLDNLVYRKKLEAELRKSFKFATLINWKRNA